MRKRPTRWDAWCCNTMPRMPNGPPLRDRMWPCASAGAFPFRDCRSCKQPAETSPKWRRIDPDRPGTTRSKRPELLLDFLQVEVLRLLFQEPFEVGAGAGDVPHAGAGPSTDEADLG